MKSVETKAVKTKVDKTKSIEMNSDDLKDVIVEALEDGKGIEIVSLDVTGKTDVTDFMVIVTGTSNRHLRSLSDRVIDACREHGVRPLGIEGVESGEWVLLDMTDVVVHLMIASARDLYDLERLWGDLEVRRSAAGVAASATVIEAPGESGIAVEQDEAGPGQE